jgi:hypothetical protein
MTVPGLQFTGVRVTGKVTKVTPPCPSHFIVNPCSFCDASIYIILIPLKDMPDGRQFFMVNVVSGGGFFSRFILVFHLSRLFYRLYSDTIYPLGRL